MRRRLPRGVFTPPVEARSPRDLYLAHPTACQLFISRAKPPRSLSTSLHVLYSWVSDGGVHGGVLVDDGVVTGAVLGGGFRLLLSGG